MINPVSSSSVTPYQTAQARTPQPTAQQPASALQDSVHLSSKAASAGDVDHDGDSH